MCSTMVAEPLLSGGVRREPFTSLDLPEWARMTEKELDELSDSDEFSDDELCDEDPELCSESPPPVFGSSPSPRCMWRWPSDLLDKSALLEIPITPSPRTFLISPGCPLLADKSAVAEPPAAHFWQTPKARPRAGLGTSPASTACPSPDACPSKATCWADLVDSDDDSEGGELLDWDPLPGSCWADLADDSDMEDSLASRSKAAVLNPRGPQSAARWADLLDSDDEA